MKNLLLCLPILSACVAVPDETTELEELDELDENTSELRFPDVTLTFFQHGNLSGTTYSVSQSALDDNERIRLVPISEIRNAGLEHRISAVRLRCGGRAARVVLFEIPNASGTEFQSWDHLVTRAAGATINCAPWRTVTVTLGDRFPALNDDVGSAFLTTHARDSGHINFTDFFESAWGAALDELPSAATPTRTEIWLTTTRTFRVRQYLTIDHWACTERGAVFEYSVRMNADTTFSAIVTDSYVDYGFGDSWGCRDKMKSSLDSAISGARDDLEGGLEEMVDFLAPGHARYYFVPDVSLRTFDLFYGADPVENAPL